jgi:hypothetical protein
MANSYEASAPAKSISLYVRSLKDRIQASPLILAFLSSANPSFKPRSTKVGLGAEH